MRKLTWLLLSAAVAALAPSTALAQVTSGGQRVQGVGDANRGDPVNVRMVDCSGSPCVAVSPPADTTVAQGSTTSGQKGPLLQATAVTADTTYTTSTTNPLTLTPSGRLRVGLSSATNLTPGTTTTVNANAEACVYRTPVTWTVGWTGAIQCDSAGNQMVSIPGTVTITDGSGTANSLTMDTPQLATTLGIKTAANSPSFAPASDAVFPVTGTFWQATQPISGSLTNISGTISLPTGAATSAGQTTTNSSLTTINTTLGTPYQAGGALPLPSGAATAAKQPALGTTTAPSADVLTTQGPVVRGSTTDANLTPTGCVANTTAPTSVTAGQWVRFWCDLKGALGTFVTDAAGNIVTVGFWNDSTSGSTNLLRVNSFNSVFDPIANTAIRMRGDVNGTVTQPYALTGSRWSYAPPSGGISNTSTAVTVAAAGGASIRNYITGVQCTFSALGAATEFGFRDGAGGSFLWRMYVGTAGGTFTFVGPIPLRGSVNTLVEVVTLTPSVTGAGYCNVQGYTGS